MSATSFALAIGIRCVSSFARRVNRLLLLVVALAVVGGPPAHGQQPIEAPLLKPFADNRQWLLFEDLRYRAGDSSITIVVPAGFVTDFASIPQAFWTLGLSPNGRYSKAAIVHDFLYWTQSCTRLQSDNILVIAMKESNVESATRATIYEGVRIGGQAAWDRNAAERTEGLLRVLPRDAFAFGPNVLFDDYRRSLRESGVEEPAAPTGARYCALGDSTDVPGPDR